MTEVTRAMLSGIRHTHSDLRKRMDNLSQKEREVVELTARGLSAKEVGAMLGITESSVSYYLRGARDGLGTDTISEAVAQVWDLRLLSLRSLIAEAVGMLADGESADVIRYRLVQGLQEQ